MEISLYILLAIPMLLLTYIKTTPSCDFDNDAKP